MGIHCPAYDQYLMSCSTTSYPACWCCRKPQSPSATSRPTVSPPSSRGSTTSAGHRQSRSTRRSSSSTDSLLDGAPTLHFPDGHHTIQGHVQYGPEAVQQQQHTFEGSVTANGTGDGVDTHGNETYADDHHSEHMEQDDADDQFGMTLDQYMSQMQTTPAACNSYSGAWPGCSVAATAVTGMHVQWLYNSCLLKSSCYSQALPHQLWLHWLLTTG